MRGGREFALRNGWDVAEARIYTDHGMSGANMMRPGLQMLLIDAQAGKFDVVVAEALDRLSRDQADVATIRKRLLFAEVDMHTLSEGEISELHIGLKGTMNALFLKDLAIKTRRGQRGRVESGKSGGGLPYGYRIKSVGEFEIDAAQAVVVQRIFKEYADGVSPRRIAAMLNRDGIVNLSGAGWTQSTLNGNPKRGTGILNNELYNGRRIWNRTRKVKDPDTGVRLSRENPPEEWVIHDVPELRIVDEALWSRAKARQERMKHSSLSLQDKRRPRNLLSFLLKCGECGGGFSKSARNHYGCSTSQNKGTCRNSLRIRQDVLEGAVLTALKQHLMRPELCAEFCREYMEHVNRLRSERNATINAWQAERDRLQGRRDRIVKAVGDGYTSEDMKNEFNANFARRKELDRLLSETPRAPVLMHPSMSERYRTEVTELTRLLGCSDRRTEAADALRSLIDRIILTPNNDRTGLVVDLHGDLAGIINLAADRDGKRRGTALDALTLDALNRFRINAMQENVQRASQRRAGRVAKCQERLAPRGRRRRELRILDLPTQRHAATAKNPQT